MALAASPALAEYYHTSFETSEGFTTGQGELWGAGGIDHQPTTVSGIWWHAPRISGLPVDAEVQNTYSYSGDNAFRFSNRSEETATNATRSHGVQLVDVAGEAGASTGGGAGAPNFKPNQHGELNHNQGGPVPTERNRNRAIVQYWWRTVVTESDTGFKVRGGMSDLAGAWMTNLYYDRAGDGSLRIKHKSYKWDPNVFGNYDDNNIKYLGLTWGNWYHVTEEVEFTDLDPNGFFVEDKVHVTLRVADPNGDPGTILWHDHATTWASAFYAGAWGYIGRKVAVDSYNWSTLADIEDQFGLGLVVDDFTFATSIPGDINADGLVNLTDLGILAGNWGSTNGWWLKGDMNQDLLVDLTDLGILAGAWGATGLSGEAGLDGSVPLAALAIPEPASLALLGLAGLALLKRTRES